MIYVSTSCVKFERICDSIEVLSAYGFCNIELSGGTKYYEGYEKDVLKLKEAHHLNYLVHNYFPPPQEDFILNIASLNDEIFEKSLSHYQSALLVSRKVGSRKFGIHPGFLMDFSLSEVGKTIEIRDLFDRDASIDRLCKGFRFLRESAKGIDLYMENNVFSQPNYQSFQGENPFLLTCFDDYVELKEQIDFGLLLDVGHLKVSANSLGLDFSEEFEKMINRSDYIHVSDNDGLHDKNDRLYADADLYRILQKTDLRHKDICIEIYTGLPDVKHSEELLLKII